MEKPRTTAERDRFGKFLLRLTGEADNDVRAEGHIRHGSPHSLHRSQCHLRCVSSPHPVQYRRGAALYRQMEVAQDMRDSGQGGDKRVRHHRRLQRSHADALHTGDIVNLPEQRRQCHAIRELLAVLAQIHPIGRRLNPGEDQFSAVSRKMGSLAQYLAGRLGAHSATRPRDDAVRAPILAAVLDFDVRPDPLRCAQYDGLHLRPRQLVRIDIDRDRPIRVVGERIDVGQHRRDLRLSVVAADVDHAGDFRRLLPRDLGKASGDDHMRALGCRAPDHLPGFAVALAGDGARVDDHDRGDLADRCVFPAAFRQSLGDFVGFTLVDPAAERDDGKGPHIVWFSSSCCPLSDG